AKPRRLAPPQPAQPAQPARAGQFLGFVQVSEDPRRQRAASDTQLHARHTGRLDRVGHVSAQVPARAVLPLPPTAAPSPTPPLLLLPRAEATVPLGVCSRALQRALLVAKGGELKEEE